MSADSLTEQPIDDAPSATSSAASPHPGAHEPTSASPELLEGLTEPQRDAVTRPGPLLVVAGAGSGKTRVLVHRIAHLITDCGVSPYELLAITFTNKAATEMQSRVGGFVGDRTVGITRNPDGTVATRRWGGMWVSTFHAACARLLRDEGHRLGYDRSFSIYDATDAARLVSLCVDDLDLDPKRVNPRAVAHAISSAKNELVDFDTYRLRAQDWWHEQVAAVYRRYQERLHRSNAFDFDDLLVKTVELFWLSADVLDQYRRQFTHVLVDEWQDTNRAQYELVKLLAGEHRNLTVVGDSDQSIYRFRGADIRNILEFESDFPDAARVTLDRNYRSTQTILDVANTVIANNTSRIAKELWTDAEAGVAVTRYTADNEHDEAAFIAEEIDRLGDQGGLTPSDCAVFYRTNAQSRVLEEVLLRVGLPYQIVGGTRFYERKEIKDVLAYLRLLVNPGDDVSAKRVLNTPRRGIGAKTEQALDIFAGGQESSFLEAARRVEENPQLGPKPAGAVSGFVSLLDQLRTLAVEGGLGLRELVETVLERTGYLAELEAERSVEALGRVENVKELVGVAEDFAAMQPDAGLPEFLERVALVSESDKLDHEADRVTMMTLHNAKGLEFPVVFMAGMEDSVFPHHRSLGDPDELEEERRLCYVGMTRAQRRLYLSSAWTRTLFGATSANPPSRFLKELPSELVVERADAGGPSRRAAADEEGGDEYAAGDRVRHPTFGAGVIEERAGAPGSQEAVVRFDESGTKRLLLAYAPLVRT
jgi:DNA helicase-2/ATP-dependent DNA helicase PcrA